MSTAPPHAIDWANLVDHHRAWIERMVVARTGGEGMVEDVIQEVNLAVARSNARPTHSGQVAPWLCKIVVRQCALIVRNQVRQQRKLDGWRQTRVPQDGRAGDPIYWLLHQECREIVREELAAMDLQARQLLIGKYLHKLSYAQIASQLNVSIHVAEYRVIEARKDFRRRLEARGVDGGMSP